VIVVEFFRGDGECRHEGKTSQKFVKKISSNAISGCGFHCIG
jgi:hypothetical protein